MKNLCAIKNSRSPIRLFTSLSVIICFVGLLAGCEKKNVEQPVEAATTGAQTQTLALPISLNELMVALVNQAADPIWVADWKNPQTDKEWRNLEYRAYQLQVGGKLLTIPGTGPLDKTWTANPQWQEFAHRLAQTGKQALAAVESRNQAAIRLAGDDIVAVCEDCHKVFKPDIPTGKKFGELSPTE